ncbi:MAG: ATP synthase F1 subunit delta [Terriglobales bacterium]
MASVTSTYARALTDVVFDRRLDPARTVREVQSLADLVARSKELREVWETPSIPDGQKRGVLDAIASREGVSAEVRNFAAVLIDHQRISFLGDIAKQFEQDLSQRLGFVEADIISARELSIAERSALERDIAKLTGKKSRAHYFRNESLLGGIVIKIGSTIYDGSVSGQLRRIREKIAASS